MCRNGSVGQGNRPRHKPAGAGSGISDAGGGGRRCGRLRRDRCCRRDDARSTAGCRDRFRPIARRRAGGGSHANAGRHARAIRCADGVRASRHGASRRSASRAGGHGASDNRSARDTSFRPNRPADSRADSRNSPAAGPRAGAHRNSHNSRRNSVVAVAGNAKAERDADIGGGRGRGGKGGSTEHHRADGKFGEMSSWRVFLRP